MKNHDKYKQYFDNYSINKIILETYISFVDSCSDPEVLLQIKENDKAIQVYLSKKEEEILSKIRVALNINDSPISLGK